MLLRNESRAKLSVDVNLVYDDGKEVHINVQEKDIVRVVYNHNGIRESVEGKVKRIEPVNRPPIPSRNGPNYEYGYRMHPAMPRPDDDIVLVVDGSYTYSGNTARIHIHDIIEIEMIEQFDERLFVKTTKNGTVNRIRVFDNKLYLSSTNGETWDWCIDLTATHVPSTPLTPATPTEKEDDGSSTTTPPSTADGDTK